MYMGAQTPRKALESLERKEKKGTESEMDHRYVQRQAQGMHRQSVSTMMGQQKGIARRQTIKQCSPIEGIYLANT